MIANLRVRTIRWAEDLTDLGNNFCPLCGHKFTFGDNIVELVTDYEGELGNVVITVHYKCLKKALEGASP
jgi:hypothetical protein